VTDIDQLEEHSQLGVVGEVARLPVRARVVGQSLSKRAERGVEVFEESIDTLRTCLILSESLRDMRVLAVTSGTNREGKTSVAVQLAVSIARASGQPTLLIDGDMRSPDVHHALEASVEPGLADVLARRCGLKEAIVTELSQPMHFLPAGRAHASPHKLLGNGVLRSVLDEARASYRYVIVDTPPVLAASEALILASAADASLICAMRDVSRLDQIKRAHERLVAAGARPVGIVLSGIPAKRYAYRYGTYAHASE
jgi:capsular exopolysaccharide synthesis family protein